MSTKTVTTKEELKTAQKDKVDEIIVTGSLAKTLVEAQKITKLSKGAMAALTTGLAAAAVTAPLTGGASLGLSAALAGPIATSTGMSLPAVLLIYTLGISVIIAIFNDYSITVEKNSDGTPRVILHKK